jgi:arginyl-tRNA synthetase
MMGMDMIHSIKFEIVDQIAKMVKKEDQTEFLYKIIEEPRDKSRGDLSLPVMRLRLNVNLNEYVKELAAKFKMTEYIIEAVAENGFLHFKLDKVKLRKIVLRQIHELDKKFGQNAYGFGKFGVVEFSSPNIAKPFHAGHLRSTIIGNFVAHVLQANGWDTISINYLGDWGKQYGLLAVGFEKYGSNQELEKDAIRHLFDVYVKINADATENPEIHDHARSYFKRMEDGNILYFNH